MTQPGWEAWEGGGSSARRWLQDGWGGQARELVGLLSPEALQESRGFHLLRGCTELSSGSPDLGSLNCVVASPYRGEGAEAGKKSPCFLCCRPCWGHGLGRRL